MIIPKTIFTFIHDKNDMNKNLKDNWQKICDKHPEYDCRLFDINDGYEFIKLRFNKRVSNAYETLIPHSFKSDLFRFAYMYIHGGIYVDIKYELVDNFTFHEFNKNYLVSEPTGIQTCLLVSQPYNILYKLTVDKICKHAEIKYYGVSPCSPTGPLCFSDVYFFEYRGDKNIHQDLCWNVYDHLQVIYFSSNNRVILRQTKTYRADLNECKKSQEHYSVFWWKKNIYNYYD